MQIIGIFLGLAAGLGQSISYIFSRAYVNRHHQGPARLLATSHVIMGLISGAILPLVWSEQMPPVGQYIWPLLGTAASYMTGQLLFFLTVRKAEASHLSPLLGVKIIILALITVIFLGQRLAGMQWLAVGLCVLATFVMNYSGRAFGAGVMLAVTGVCMLWAFADLGTFCVLRRLVEVGPVRSVFITTFMCYSVCGLVGLALLPWTGKHAAGDWRWAAPHAVSWLGAIIVLVACLSIVGVLLAAILQSTRGIISVLMGAQVARLGWVHLERRATRATVVRRLFAAAMMVLAVCLYAIANRSVT